MHHFPILCGWRLNGSPNYLKWVLSNTPATINNFFFSPFSGLEKKWFTHRRASKALQTATGLTKPWRIFSLLGGPWWHKAIRNAAHIKTIHGSRPMRTLCNGLYTQTPRQTKKDFFSLYFNPFLTTTWSCQTGNYCRWYRAKQQVHSGRRHKHAPSYREVSTWPWIMKHMHTILFEVGTSSFVKQQQELGSFGMIHAANGLQRLDTGTNLKPATKTRHYRLWP